VIDTPDPHHVYPGAVIIGLVYILLPFMVMPLYSSIEKLDKPLLEAAKIWVQQMRHPHYHSADHARHYRRLSAGDAPGNGAVLRFRSDAGQTC
jgi:hypothetical protein